MKKLLCFLGVLILLLAGCSNESPVETVVTTAPATTEPEPTGVYMPQSDLESETQGAVRMYDISAGNWQWVAGIGGDVLLGETGSKTMLTVLSGEEGYLSDPAELSFHAHAAQSGSSAVYGGYAFYDADNKQMLFLDAQLSVTETVVLPEDATGNPICSPDGSQIYYCAGQEVRSMDVQRGITRLIKSHGCKSQTILGCYMNGEVLAVMLTYADDSRAVVYISATDGLTITTQKQDASLYTAGDAYVLFRKDGIVRQILFEGQDGISCLNIPDTYVYAALDLGGVLGFAVTEEGVQASVYDMVSGKVSASVALKGYCDVESVYVDGANQLVWMLLEPANNGKQMLLRWDPYKSPVEDETVYTGPRYTAENPDKDGIKLADKRTDKLETTHGVTIRIWTDATKRSVGPELETEYQTEAINSVLDDLEQVLELFPDNFLYKSVTNYIRICIVRSIDGRITYGQYWVGTEPYIVICPGVDVREAFIRSVSYVVESHTLGNSSLIDTWEDLNPDGFAYSEEVIAPEGYLEGDERAFVDEASMVSVTEDRSRVFWQAMLPDNAEVFASETMQAKLRQLCLAIRDAWRWEKKTEVFLWEQYLNEPVAYQK